jgi:hypothetical protein
MIGQTLMKQEPIVIMAKISKDDCIPLEDAMKAIGKSKATLYNYMNALDIQRHKFAYDRKTYILKGDLDRLLKFIETHQR